MGLTRTYNNQLQGDFDGPIGFNWLIDQMPAIAQDNIVPANLAVWITPTTAVWFQFNASDSTYSTLYALNGVHRSLTAEGEYLVYRESSSTKSTITKFWNFSSRTSSLGATAPNGAFYSYTDQWGQTTAAVSYNTNQVAELQRIYVTTTGGTTTTTTYSVVYTFNWVYAADQYRINNILQRYRIGSGDWVNLRSATYQLCEAGEPYGSTNDLKYVFIKDGAGNLIDEYYYRYYTAADVAGGAPGFVHGLKFIMGPDSFARAERNLGVVDGNLITDAQAAVYADNYFEYDANRAVTKEIAQGAGCSCSGGTGTGTFTYARSTNTSGTYTDDYNKWKYKTVETLPDSNTNTIYSNFQGQIMLSVFTDVPSGKKWCKFYRYDPPISGVPNSGGHLWWLAESSAVLPPASGDAYDLHDDLLNYSSGAYTYLSSDSGLIHVYSYATSTTATTSAAGDVLNFLQNEAVKKGGGTSTPIPLRSMLYKAHTADATGVGDHGGDTVYMLDSETQYNGTGGTGAETTSYSLTWVSIGGGLATNRKYATTRTAPLISTAQNGPGGSANDITAEVYDPYGRVHWTKDGDGYLNYFGYDDGTMANGTGAMVKTIKDVDTSSTGFADVPYLWATPTGGGKHLSTYIGVDGWGRTTKTTDANSNVTFRVYKDAALEIREYPGWQSGTSQTTGPVRVSRKDRTQSPSGAGTTGMIVFTDELTMAPSSISVDGSGAPTGGEAISNVLSIKRQVLDNGDRVDHENVYFGAGLNYEPTLEQGDTSGWVNLVMYRTSFGYDIRGRRSRIVNPLGTITNITFDGLNRVTSKSIGTNDTIGSSNMIDVEDREYDGGNVGDNTITKITQHQDGTDSLTPRSIQKWYDWRDRLIAIKGGVQSTEDSTTHRPVTFQWKDNLGRTTTREICDGDGASASTIAADVAYGSLQTTLSGKRRYKTGYNFDDQDRIYQTLTFSVDQSSGSVSSAALTTNNYFDHRSNLIETSMPGGLVSKSAFDGASRLSKQYNTDGAGGTGWSHAFDVSYNAVTVSGDNVLQETMNAYDNNGNVTLTTVKLHNHDDTNTGELGDASTTPKARVSYTASYYDAANRMVNSVNVGTNGGSTFSPPSSPPSRSDTVLVTDYHYNPAGWVDEITDPKSIVLAKAYDLLGRVTDNIEAYSGSLPVDATVTVSTDHNRITHYIYDGLSHVYQLTAKMPSGTPNQTTQYNYGVNAGTSGAGSGSKIYSNDLLGSVNYPLATGALAGSPSSAAADTQTFSYNAAGQAISFIDQNGSLHAYVYDVLGRRISDAVTTLGSGVDNAVLAQGISFDTGGRPYQLTSYSSATSLNSSHIVSQVEDDYNGLGQLKFEYQEHGGAVNTSTSPKVQYSYSEMSSGANHSRLTAMTYPNSRVLTYDYGTSGGLNDAISRIANLKDGATTDVSYTYIGLGSLVQKSFPGPGITMDLWGGTSGSYAGLDNFGRVIDQKWTGPGGSGAGDEFQYGYDRDNNALYKNNLGPSLSALSELYHSSAGLNTAAYDGLNRLVSFERGTLSATNTSNGGGLDTVTAPSSSETWALDTLGNWSIGPMDGSSTSPNINSKNQYHTISGTNLFYDGNGNMTTDEHLSTYIYDAWNRLISVTNVASTVIAGYGYDAHGWRIKETHGLAETDLYYSHAWQVIEEKQTTTTTAQYTWSLEYVDALAFRDDSTSLSRRIYAQHDADWNTTALVNNSGTIQVQERFVYDPYGNAAVLTAGGSSTTDSYNWIYLHQGGRFDPITGLYDFRCRNYIPAQGRWLQPEPFSGTYIDGLNLYESDLSDPVCVIDPMGLDVALVAPAAAPLVAGGEVSVIPGAGIIIAGGTALGSGIYYSGIGEYIGTDWLGDTLADWWMGPTQPLPPLPKPRPKPLPKQPPPPPPPVPPKPPKDKDDSNCKLIGSGGPVNRKGKCYMRCTYSCPKNGQGNVFIPCSDTSKPPTCPWTREDYPFAPEP
jgi:RHS repeat-associated protein